MNKKIVWGLAAAAVFVIVAMRLAGYPPVKEGTEATIGTAQRYQAPQIEAKDVAVGDTSVQALMRRLDLNREAHLVIRNGTLVPGDTVLADDDAVEVRPVISGGAT